MCNILEFSLNCQQYKVGISANFFFPFISLIEFIVDTHEFWCKMLFNFVINNNELKELMCQDKYKKIKLKLKHKNAKSANTVNFV